MAKFKYIDSWKKVVCENDNLSEFWKDFTKTEYFQCDVVGFMWECCMNYDVVTNHFPTMEYIYPFVKTYVEKANKINDVEESEENFEKWTKMTNIVMDIITTICKNDNYCRDLLIKDFQEFKVD